jgi:hypothetical protein
MIRAHVQCDAWRCQASYSCWIETPRDQILSHLAKGGWAVWVSDPGSFVDPDTGRAAHLPLSCRTLTYCPTHKGTFIAPPASPTARRREGPCGGRPPPE